MKYYRLTIDDNIRFIEDIQKNSYESIFENPYLCGLKHLHDSYNMKIQLNMFMSYTKTGFSLAQFPDKYKPQFEASSDWLHLAFHSKYNDPECPYEGTPSDVILNDFDAVTNELVRIAGKAVNNDIVTVHWVLASKESCVALKNRGVKGFMGLFSDMNGTPTTSYYLTLAQSKEVLASGIWADPETGLDFFCNHLVINNYKRTQVNGRLKHMLDRGQEYIDLMLHEQYFYSDYFEYHKDYMKKLDDVGAMLSDKKYVSVFPKDIYSQLA